MTLSVSPSGSLSVPLPSSSVMTFPTLGVSSGVEVLLSVATGAGLVTVHVKFTSTLPPLPSSAVIVTL